MWEACGDAEQCVERRFHVSSAIPSKDEFVEISAQVERADAMIGSERPALEIGEDAMDPHQTATRPSPASNLAKSLSGQAPQPAKSLRFPRSSFLWGVAGLRCNFAG